jgi:LacI family gluconate utilization system Gnt-I transcriptional repressor
MPTACRHADSGCSRDTCGTDRRLGFQAAMADHGPDAARLVAAGPPPISMREGAVAMGARIEALPGTEAVICLSDLSAIGALTECQRHAMEVPGRIAIGGFGDYEIASVCVPGLTTLNPFARRIGAEMAALILELRDRERAAPARIVIDPVPIPRGSSR